MRIKWAVTRTALASRRTLPSSRYWTPSSRPIRSVDENLPVSLRVFLKKYGVLPAHVTLFHVNQVSVAEAEGGTNLEVINLGRNIVAVSGTYGYMERLDVRGALRELQLAGKIDIPSHRWIIAIGEEDIIVCDDACGSATKT